MNSSAFKGTLILSTIGLLIYTILTIQNDGFNFLGSAAEFVSSLEWKGQFSLDFALYLFLSALWIMWREKFSVAGILLALCAATFGYLFFAPYLLFIIGREKGQADRILLGKQLVS